MSKQETFKPGTPVTLLNGLRSGYVYVTHTAKRHVICNLSTGEIKQVYPGKLALTKTVLEQILKVAA